MVPPTQTYTHINLLSGSGVGVFIYLCACVSVPTSHLAVRKPFDSLLSPPIIMSYFITPFNKGDLTSMATSR